MSEQTMRQALEALWIWASEQRTHLDSDPVPDGLGRQVLHALDETGTNARQVQEEAGQ